VIIRFTSTLTADDEGRIATALLKALRYLLAPFPISYAIRIETTAGDVIEDSGAVPADPWLESGSRGEQPVPARRPRYGV
jgi:hypothetical protein